MTRTFLIAGNWKMHRGVAATTALLEELLAEDLPTAVDTVVCPPFTSLPAAAMLLSASAVGLGAQNVHWAVEGAFTGEVSAAMLREAGVEWVIVGHSERRTLFGEGDDTAARRARCAQDQELTVIYCVGETLEQREANRTFDVVREQLGGSLAEIPAEQGEEVVIAYEPVWAIGTGRTATPEMAQEVHAFIRERLAFASGALGTASAFNTGAR